ncbi:hypothetical protein CYJ76_02260 [Kytococcus schroeteri]|uniref:DUF4190 domain-containing protein n=1 Tax=Kytococcus schroeteri TaxID=138300 RepID=A0A2I1PCN8_9MICO|nr:hypothetical protein [Kytococcus schroeteri]PKZ42403.1 hypothetical protein CYJ76_02260 [Kytococcus schroeteri]
MTPSSPSGPPAGEQSRPQLNPSSQPAVVPGAYGPYPGGPGQEEHPDGVPVFVTGLLSLIAFPPIGFLAWVMGNRARRDIRSQPGRYRNEGLVTAGWVMGIIGGLITLFLGALFVLMFGLGIGVPILIGLSEA